MITIFPRNYNKRMLNLPNILIIVLIDLIYVSLVSFANLASRVFSP